MIYVDDSRNASEILIYVKNKNPPTNLLYCHHQYSDRMYILVDMKSNEGIYRCILM